MDVEFVVGIFTDAEIKRIEFTPRSAWSLVTNDKSKVTEKPESNPAVCNLIYSRE